MINELKVGEFINRKLNVVCCSAHDNISSVKTKMLVNNFSQIPIVDETCQVHGCVTWKSIGRKEIISHSPGSAIDFSEDPTVVGERENFLDYIEAIADNEYVLVKDNNGALAGIITTYDMTVNFKNFIIPYLTTGMIEECLRSLINNKIGAQKPAEEMMFGEYIKILKDKKKWERLGFNHIDHDVFVHKLDDIRHFRNRIAHYNPDRINDEEQYLLKSFSELLEQIVNVACLNKKS